MPGPTENPPAPLLLRRTWPGVVVLACILLASFFQLRMVIHIDPAHLPDLYPPWYGSLAALHGHDPYQPDITRHIQQQMYGHIVTPRQGWDPMAFVYPATILPLLAPFTLLPWPVVSFLFALLGPVAVAASAWAWMEVCGLRLDRRSAAFVIALAALSWPAFWGSCQRQPSLYVCAAIAFSVWLYLRRSDVGSGILLAAATVKPQLVILIALWLIAVAILQRRWRFLASFAAALAILLAASLLLLPGWIPRWIAAVRAYARFPGKNAMLVFLLGHTAGIVAAVLLAAALLVWLFRQGRAALEAPAFARSSAAVLAVTLCIIPGEPSLLFNNLLLLPAIFLSLLRPASGPLAGALQAVARLALIVALAAVLLCAPLAAIFGPAQALAAPPFLLNYLLPIPFAAAILWATSPGVVNISRRSASAAVQLR